MQGRFKRDGGAAGDPEQRGGADTGPIRREDTADVGTAGAESGATPESGVRSGPKHGSRIAMRNWRISTRLVSLLALPVVAATTLGALRIQSSLENVKQLDAMTSLTDLTEQATKLAAALQNERDVSAGPLSSTPRDENDDDIVAAQQNTKLARQAFSQAEEGIDPDLTGVNASLQAIHRQLGTLQAIRERAYDQSGFVSSTVSEYDGLIQSLIDLSQEMAEATGNTEMIASTRALAAFSAAKEYESIQRAVVSAALADDKKLSSNDFRFMGGALRSERTALEQFRQIYGRQKSEDLLGGLEHGNAAITQHDEQAARIAASEEGIQNFDGSYLDWDDAAKTKLDTMKAIEQHLLEEMQQQALTLRDEAQQEAIISGALILLVLGISVVGAFVVARSMVRSLRRLQDTAQEVAQKRLPELVKQLSESDPQDVDTSVESIGIHTRDEIGQVARAFDEVHREAVRLAAEQALLRGNVNAMFTNLSRRSQGLIQRQLSLISELESREADPDQLSSLFKLDHLATRMRRNGENLLVLAGEEPGRRWTRPVPLVDVLRAAASEVEQYERIELTSVPAVEVTGRVVNDLVHLLAELLENATSFSSPQTKVRVTGHALPDGRVLIEIHDTGIGLSPEDLADINERLANPPTVDVSVSRRMGLFVVGRLSLRHGIRIQLRPSDSGGTTALVMLPVDVTQGGAKPQPGAAGNRGQQPGGPGAGGPGGAVPAGAPAGGVGRAPQRGQVPGSAPRPALNSGPAGPGQAPQGGRPGAPAAPQRSGPSWANEQQGQGGQSRPQRHAGPQQQPQAPQAPQYPQQPAAPQPVGAAADMPRGHEDLETTAQFERPDFNTIPHTSPQRGTMGSAFGRQQQPQQPQQQYQQEQPPQYQQEPQLPQHQQQYQHEQQPQYQQEQPPQQQTGTYTRSDVFQRPTGPQAQMPQAPMAQAPMPPAPQTQRHRGPAAGQQQRPGEQRHPLPAASEPMALPPAPARPDETSPIFDSLESDWFRTGRAERMQQVHVERGPVAPQQNGNGPLSGSGPLSGGAPSRPPQRPHQPAPQQHPQQPQQPPQRVRAEQPQAQQAPPPPRREPAAWRSSPNDEVWQRAGQVREPSAGGVTPSGLPRRVPRANLVPGSGTTQQAPQGGPQVSRAPDDVRGRLTNLRRGIQQGRQAGTGTTDGRGFGTTHQQER
ncbi:nitrate- and nitrite sensing domain-containing protein [Streptomyces sp. MI02-7b]|uniref:sensor histidine kinase n=1 Tax=Streptomyces sp. MI02-7b TaxID=462941 RepID=UPI0029B6E6CA|nr:nitrate- and nitrite sensing domain-containing protein [Streptomyces sp. MI02-7b]MDX3073054.1 nitrate- and nitrite sensing domain-containing protein [Streptomyces sp. MI02-7b]